MAKKICSLTSKECPYEKCTEKCEVYQKELEGVLAEWSHYRYCNYCNKSMG